MPLFKGEDLDSGLVDWIKAEIRDGPRQGYELGKFFFSVSAASIGAILAIEKLNEEYAMDLPMIACLSVLLFSIFSAINMVRPRSYLIGGSTDLEDVYLRQIRRAQIGASVWLALWVTGMVIGAVAVRA